MLFHPSTFCRPQSLVASLVLVSLLAAISDAADFAWKFRTGERIRVTIDTKTQIDIQSVGAEGQTSTIHQILNLEWNVLSVSSERVAEIEQKVARVQLESDGSTGNVQFDSQSSSPNSNNAGQPIAKPLANLVNATLRLKMKPNGEILDGELVGPNGSKTDEVAGSRALNVLEPFMANGIRFPSASIEIGEPWTDSFPMELSSFYLLKMSTTYQYLGEEKLESKTLDKFKTSTAFRLNNKLPAVKLTKQDAMGTIWFDRNAGKMVRLENAQELSLVETTQGKETEQSLVQSVEIQFTPQ